MDSEGQGRGQVRSDNITFISDIIKGKMKAKSDIQCNFHVYSVSVSILDYLTNSIALIEISHASNQLFP